MSTVNCLIVLLLVVWLVVAAAIYGWLAWQDRDLHYTDWHVRALMAFAAAYWPVIVTRQMRAWWRSRREAR